MSQMEKKEELIAHKKSEQTPFHKGNESTNCLYLIRGISLNSDLNVFRLFFYSSNFIIYVKQ